MSLWTQKAFGNSFFACISGSVHQNRFISSHRRQHKPHVSRNGPVYQDRLCTLRRYLCPSPVTRHYSARHPDENQYHSNDNHLLFTAPTRYTREIFPKIHFLLSHKGFDSRDTSWQPIAKVNLKTRWEWGPSVCPKGNTRNNTPSSSTPICLLY